MQNNDPGWFSRAFTGYSQQGQNVGGIQTAPTQVGPWVPPVMNAAGSLFQGIAGMEQMRTARRQLRFQRNAFNKQFDMQRNLTNQQLENRERFRQRQSGGVNTNELNEFMDRNRLT